MSSKNGLLDFREEINTIDKDIVELLAKRKNLALKIAELKIQNNQKIRDVEREKKLLEKLINLGKKNNLSSTYIIKLFKLIIKESILIQEKSLKTFYIKNELFVPSLSFLGPKGSYSHIAACQYSGKYFRKYIEHECLTFKEVISKVEKKQSDYAVLPIENSCSGFIDEIFYLLKNTNLFIIEEINIAINHCLIGTEKSKLNTINTVYSHFQPFQQCSSFIENFPHWKIKYTNSTSNAVKKIAKYKKITNAAIGNEFASQIYGLKILSRNLENKKNNVTRFIILSQKSEKIFKKELNKTILIISVEILNKDKKTKIISKILLILKKRNLTVNKIASKIINNCLSEEVFYIEILEKISSLFIQEAFKKIKNITKFAKILNYYPQ